MTKTTKTGASTCTDAVRTLRGRTKKLMPPKPPRVYWIRLSVDPHAESPDDVAGAVTEEASEFIHVLDAHMVSNGTLLGLIETALTDVVAEDLHLTPPRFDKEEDCAI